jgi:cell division protein FtsZ
MSDEIRITVIATGFEDVGKKRQGIPNVTHLGGYRREDLSMPTYVRNKEKSIDHVNAVKMGAIDDDNPDLEIPTFLRRQAD